MKKVTNNQKELIALAEATIKKEKLKSLTQNAKIVLGNIINLSKLDFYKDNGYCFRTNLDIMTDCDIKSKKTLYLALNTLESLGLIQRISGGKKDANRFILKSGLESGLAGTPNTQSGLESGPVKLTDNEEVKSSGLAILIEKVDYLIKCTSLLSQQTQYLSKIAEYLYKCTSPSSVPDKCTIDIEIDKDIDIDNSYRDNSNESITNKENKNNINNTLTELKESDGKTVEMENNNEIISNFSFDEDESTVNEIDDNISTENISNESTIIPDNVIGVAAVQQPKMLSNIYLSFSRDGKDNSISSTDDGEDNIISMGDSNIDSMTSTEVQEEIGTIPQNLLYNDSPKKAPHFLPNETKDKEDEDFKRSIYQRLVYDPSQTNEQIKELYNDIVKLRDSNKVPQNEMDLIVYGFTNKVKYISALRDKCKL